MPFGDLFALLGKQSRLEKPGASNQSSVGDNPAHMKPFNTIAVAVFVLFAFVHLIRLILGWQVTVNHLIIPMWVSVLGLVVAAMLALMLWLENYRPR